MSGKVRTFQNALRSLTAKLEQVELAKGMQQVSVDVSGSGDPLCWLPQVSSAPFRWYWAGRHGNADWAGWGVADEVREASPLRLIRGVTRRINKLGGEARYVGGFRFDPEARQRNEWADFGRASMWLPRFVMRRDKDGASLSCYLRRDERDRLIRKMHGWGKGAILPSGEPLSAITSRQDKPEEARWLTTIDNALEELDTDTLQKIVLARRTAFEFGDSIQSAMLLRRLRDATPGCFHFLLQPSRRSSFIGASPERLLRLNGRFVATEAVAGTRPRGDSAEWDAALKDELLTSDKDRREHAHVQRYLQQVLSELCDDVRGDEEPGSLTLKRGRHLYARLEGTLKPEVSLAELTNALHPTPAVAGLPATRAIARLREAEPFDRGWYAGGIGWIGREEAEFAVGIRSGLIRNNRLNLYAGAGIVPGSDPADEWDEVEHKISDFLELFSEASTVGR